MAVKTFYLKNAVPAGATLHRSLQDGGSAPAAATTTTGWVAGTNAAGQSCIQTGGTEYSRTGGNWGTTLQPSAAPSQTIGDCWRSENALTGDFANTAWTCTFQVRSVTAAYTGRFKLAVRLWRSTDANGVGAVELTAGRVASSATTASLTTTADTAVAVSVSPGLETFSNEYLFMQVGVEITSAGGGTTQDIDFRVGSTATVVTPDFTVTTSSTVAGTDGVDVAAVGAATWTTAQIAVTDGADLAAAQTTTSVTTNAAIAAADGADVSTAATAVTTGATVAATDGADVATTSAATWTTAQVLATDAPDLAAPVARVTTGATISATDSADTTAAVAATWTTGQIAATDAADTAAAAGRVTTGAVIAATDGADSATAFASVSSTTSASIAATDGADQNAALTLSTMARIVGTDGADNAVLAAQAYITPPQEPVITFDQGGGGLRARRRVRTHQIWTPSNPVYAPDDEQDALHLIGIY